MEDFVHLHVHTYYSILDGQSKISNLVNKAIGNGMKGMAITDHGVMFGIKEFWDYCSEVNKKRKADGLEPFKPILGCEMYVARHRKEDKVKENGDNSGYHLIVLAKNYQGYKNLIKLVSRSWVDGYYYRPRTDREDLEKYHEGLIICTACLAGEVPRKIMADDLDGAREACLWYKNLFGDDFYLELQRHQVTDPTLLANRTAYPLQQKVNAVLEDFSKELGIKLVCTNDCHFEDKETAEAHDHLLCLATGKDLDDPNRMRYSKQEWFKTREEMNEVFPDHPEAMRNTLEILDKVEFYSIDHDPVMPFFPIPESFGTEEQWRQKFTEEDLYKEFCSDENGENPMSAEDGEKRIKHLGGYDKIYRIKFEADYLDELTFQGAKRIYGDPVPKEVEERIRFELHVMKTMGFPGYFLIVQDFINSAREQLGVMVGPGRGSAAGSVAAYCLGITKIDPLKYDLLFERFLNPDRISLPDIDTDFDDDGRGRVLQWVMDKYGHENCAHIITYGSMATKNSIKDVARVEKLPLEKANALCKAIPDRLPNGLKMNLTNAIKSVDMLREAEASIDPRERNTMKYAKMLEGTVRGTGIHACGFIICRDPISDWVPISTADDPDFKDLKVPVTQYDGHVIESTGLIKMDFLGLKTLSELKEAVKNVKLTTGVEVDLDNIPIDDELTYQLYQQGRTIGTFQFESPGMQKYLRELHPTVFGDLIAMNALYRPGPMDNIPSFIARKLGKEPITYPIPEMEKYLKDTYGITVYQEQVMLLSRLLAGFTRGQSDTLRKAMGKKKIDQMNKLEKLFYEGGEARGHDHKTLNHIWEEWKKFASYAFNKSHAACYSWVAFQTAYMKAHYPAEFMAAIMTRRKSDIKEITKLMDECKSMGIPTLEPSVNESYGNFGVNQKGEIRFGLAAIKGMGEQAAEAIINERNENGPYKDIFDFAQRVDFSNVNRKAFESLAMSGGFDCFGLKREQYFGKNNKGDAFLDTLVRYGQLYQAEQAEARNSLFGGSDAVEIATPPIPQVEEWSTIEKLNHERDLVGIYLSAHPLDEFSIILNSMCNTHCAELEDKEALVGKQEITIGGMVTAVKSGFTKSGKPYGVVTLEDFEGSGELFIMDAEWGRWSGMFIQGAIIFMKANCSKRYPTSTYVDFKIADIQYMQTIRDTRIERFTISMDINDINETIVNDISTLVSDSPGHTMLFIQVVDKEHNSNLILRSRAHEIGLTRDFVNYVESNPVMSYHVN
ncbi:DNA polymerase III, alpha subunit [Prevotella sp. DNF00663]|uniref:DNA polymerase III subunit alpha n=1 Tax=Prevotella sp. DNF00663 TaxID=1384078 RepID=UPI00078530E7|nr:DNA polymerase III subunit alpha [Prevotella sp. DNF00663]KXB83382.1 DNA polymerase III, alpha subunit [Prevotella sp. DNF00663]